MTAGERGTLRCDLRECFPDGTPHLNPSRVAGVEIVMVNGAKGDQVVIDQMSTSGDADKWQSPKGRIEMPEIVDGEPRAGCRTRYKIDDNSPLYGVLYLPKDWKRGAEYPLIVEFPGNIFYTKRCYSTGLPEQCAIGYGVTKGEGAILLSLPFVNYSTNSIAPDRWGVADDSADFMVKMVDHICAEYGGDRSNVMITGFSRGAIACGFIGLRNAQIASLWSKVHCCQHFDGDGWGGSKLADAVKRLEKASNIPQFHTDNESEVLRTMLSNAEVDVTYVESGLGAHSTMMFMDDRESTQLLRRWYLDVK